MDRPDLLVLDDALRELLHTLQAREAPTHELTTIAEARRVTQRLLEQNGGE